MARNVFTGASHVLVSTEESNGGIGFSSISCDRSAGILAVATGGEGCAAATAVHLYTLSDAKGQFAGKIA